MNLPADARGTVTLGFLGIHRFGHSRPDDGQSHQANTYPGKTPTEDYPTGKHRCRRPRHILILPSPCLHVHAACFEWLRSNNDLKTLIPAGSCPIAHAAWPL